MSPPRCPLPKDVISSVPTWLKTRGGPSGQGWCLFSSLNLLVPGPRPGRGGSVNNSEWMKGLGFHGKSSERSIFILTCQWLHFPSPYMGESIGYQEPEREAEDCFWQWSETHEGCLGRPEVSGLDSRLPTYTSLSAAKDPAPLPVPTQPLGQWPLQMGKRKFSSWNQLTWGHTQGTEFISYFLWNFTSKWLGNFLSN